MLSEFCISETEFELYKLINDYRNDKGLSKIELSKSLSFVAKTHAKDLAENYKESERCNMHSWSNNGDWSSCCYSSDHRKAKCMWNKPEELTNYKGIGYEIAFYSTDPADLANQAEASLRGWKKSKGHNSIIINRGQWKKAQWKSLGIGIYGDYVVAWFGQENDPDGKPTFCEQ
ncbi:MAG: CAP domain-containing protein [Bacteroidales bacterium]|nr:CAP domain-containing protein [Bacteroidales bacterium]